MFLCYYKLNRKINSPSHNDALSVLKSGCKGTKNYSNPKGHGLKNIIATEKNTEKRLFSYRFLPDMFFLTNFAPEVFCH